MSRVSIHSITDFYHRYRILEKILKNVPARMDFFRTFVNSEGHSDFRFGSQSITESLQFQIVKALHLGERDKASHFLSIFSRGNDPLRAHDFVYILDYCARFPDPLFGMETWRIMEEKEIGMNKRCYMLIIKALTKGGYLEEAFNLLCFLGQNPLTAPDLHMYNFYLSECARIGSMGHASSCLDQMEKQMVGKSEITYRELLKLAVLQQNLPAVHAIWKQLTKYYIPNIISVQQIIKSFARLGDLFSAFEALQHAVALTVQGNTSFRISLRSTTLDIPIPSTVDFAYKKCSISPAVVGLTRAEGELRENHVGVSNAANITSVEAGTSCRNLALFPVGNQDSEFCDLSREYGNKSSGVLNRRSGPVPGINILRSSFNEVMHACAKARNYELAEHLFLQMQKLGLELSSHTYDFLIRAVVYKRGVASGLNLLKTMEDMNFKPHPATLTTLSIGCSNILKLDLAEALLDRIDESPRLLPFNSLLAACHAMDQPERAVRILAKMKHLKLKSDIRTYELLFSLLGKVNAPYQKGDKWSQLVAEKRINIIEMDMGKNGVKHNHLSVVNLLGTLGAEGMIRQLFQYLRMLENQFFLNNTFEGTIIYNSVLHTLLKAKCNSMAIQVFKDMKCHDLSPDAATYSIMIDGCSNLRCFNSACMFVSMMMRDGFSLGTCTYTSLIKILLLNDGFDEALRLFHQMSSEGIQPDIVLYNTILRRGRFKRRIDIIEHIVEKMHQDGIQPDPTTCSVVFGAYVHSGFLNTAMEALQVLSMRMISVEASVLEEKRQYFEENFILAEDSEVELRLVEIFEDSREYLATALLNLRWCAIAGCSISWSPDQNEWAKQLSSSYGLKNAS